MFLLSLQPAAHQTIVRLLRLRKHHKEVLSRHRREGGADRRLKPHCIDGGGAGPRQPADAVALAV